jgi:hypothetical protein
MDSSDDRIVIENVNVPGSMTCVSRAMYEAMRQAMWKVLPATAPGLTQSEFAMPSCRTCPKIGIRAAPRLAGGPRPCSWIRRPRESWRASRPKRCVGIELPDWRSRGTHWRSPKLRHRA